MMKLVDIPDLKSGAERRAGSIPAPGTSGAFPLNSSRLRIGRNPKTDKRVDVPGKYSPLFKARKEMRERVTGADK